MEQTCDVLKIILHDHLTAPPEFVHVYLGGVLFIENFGGIQRWGWAIMLFVSLNILDIGRIFFLFFFFAAMNFVASDNKKTNLRCKTEVC